MIDPPNATGFLLDVAGGDRVVGLDLAVKNRSGIPVQAAADRLGQGEWPRAGECGDLDSALLDQKSPPTALGKDFCLSLAQ